MDWGNRINRLKNRKEQKRNHESDLLNRDLNRGHRTTRVKRLLRRIATKENE